MSCLKSTLKHATLAQDIYPLSDLLSKVGKKVSKLPKGERVTLVICTQGLPTDRNGAQRDFWSKIRNLSKLDVKIVVCLCTDKEGVRDLYNTMDCKVENMDVLDDYWCKVSASVFESIIPLFQVTSFLPFNHTQFTTSLSSDQSTSRRRKYSCIIPG